MCTYTLAYVMKKLVYDEKQILPIGEIKYSIIGTIFVNIGNTIVSEKII
jgi:hypothetical protein